MKRKAKEAEFDDGLEISASDSEDTDTELQEAFAAGILKPGLNFPTIPKEHKNNVEGLKKKLSEFKSNLPWIERMDITCQPAAMAPEMFHELSEKEKDSVVRLKTHMQEFSKNSCSPLALDDFKREMLFHRQAQAAILEGIARLSSLGIPTQRPDDYFAEMAKSDEHMHKVRESLAARQAGLQKSERVAELRKQRKLSKQSQIENKEKQAKEKKRILNEVQKFRKGARKDLDFLDSKKNNQQGGKSRPSLQRKKRDERYGFGGKKRGSKRNTKDSAGFVKKNASKPSRGSGKKTQSNKRPGKSKRMKSKGRRVEAT